MFKKLFFKQQFGKFILRNYSICNKYGLSNIGIYGPNNINYNLTQNELFKHEVKNNEGKVFKTKYGDTFGVDTGKFTGRSPKDKWIVKSNKSEKNIWWGDVNQPITYEVFDHLLSKSINHFNSLDNHY